MNKKGQTVITLAFLVVTALFVWAFLAETIGTTGHQAALLALSDGHGFEAMLWDNLNLWIFVGILLFTAVGGFVLSNQ